MNTGTITGRVSDLEATVQVNGIPVTIVELGAFTIDLTLTEGKNTITAVATDGQGDTGTDSVTVIYDTVGPQISITSPTDGAAALVNPISVIGTVSDANLSEVRVNMVPATISEGEFTAEGIELKQGENTITAVAKDKVGNTAEDSVNVTLGEEAPSYNLEEVYGNTTEINDPALLPEVGTQWGLKVKLLINNQPADGETIQFQITEGEGQLNQQQVQTDNEGGASVGLTLDTNVEHINRVTAWPVECPQEKVEFFVTGRAAPSAVLAKLTDETLTYVPDAEIELIVKLTDTHNNPIEKEQVNFTVLSGDGELLQESATTSEMGEAYVGYTIGPTAGVINTIKAELASDPAVNTTFNLQTIALPDGITVDDVMAKVNENDEKIQDIQADIVVTSDAPWADPETHLHIWQKGEKQKVQMSFPKEMIFIRPQRSYIYSPEIEFFQQIIFYIVGDGIYGLKFSYTTEDGSKSTKLLSIDYNRGIVVKTENITVDTHGRSMIITEYRDWVQIPEADDAWLYDKKVEIFSTNFTPNIYTTTRNISNREVNTGIPDEIFE